MKMRFIFYLFFNIFYVISFAININNVFAELTTSNTFEKCYIDGTNNCESETSSCIEEKWQTASSREKYLRNIRTTKLKSVDEYIDWIGTPNGQEYKKTSDYIEYKCSPGMRNSKFFSIRAIEIILFKKKYEYINNIYGKYKVIDHNCKNTSYAIINCNNKKYSKIQNNLFNKLYSDELGKIVTISKDLYEYPYYESNKSNYFVYNDKDLGEWGGKRDYVFYEDKKCKIQQTIMCHKVDNPVYEILFASHEDVQEYAPHINEYTGVNVNEMIILSIYRKPADYELPLDGDNEYILQDRIYFILKEDGKVQILKNTGAYYSGVILEKID